MIDFSTLQRLTIPEGVVTQIADSEGNVLWALASESSEPIVLKVKKITSNTYAGSTAYNNEQFILLDIYPKTANSVVEVTYGDVTKTLTFSGSNAKQVYFGTFNGVSDDVETPVNGTLTIKGECAGVGASSYYTDSKGNTNYCGCITAITKLVGISFIPAHAFHNCNKLTSITIPDSVTSIGEHAFDSCDSLTSTTIPDSVTSIGDGAFYGCDNLTSVIIPDGITSIGNDMFHMCKNLTNVNIPNSVTSIDEQAFYYCDSLTNIIIPDSVTSIGFSAFNSCVSLTSITIPDSVTSIGKSAFSGCTNLTHVIIGDGVTDIEVRAFQMCDNLSSVIFNNTFGWRVSEYTTETGTAVDVTDPAINATLINNTYVQYYWKRS